MLRGVPEVSRSAPESCAESRSRGSVASKACCAETLRRKLVARKRCVVPGPGLSRQIVQGVGWSESHCQTSSRTVWQNLHSIVLF